MGFCGECLTCFVGNVETFWRRIFNPFKVIPATFKLIRQLSRCRAHKNTGKRYFSHETSGSFKPKKAFLRENTSYSTHRLSNKSFREIKASERSGNLHHNLSTFSLSQICFLSHRQPPHTKSDHLKCDRFHTEKLFIWPSPTLPSP